MTPQEVRSAIYRQMLRHQDKVFQTAQIRRELGWPEEDPRTKRLHAVVQTLKREGVIQTTGTPRKRHQYLMISKPGELRTHLDAIGGKRHSANGKANAGETTPPRGGPPRVRYLEERVGELEQSLGLHNDRFDELLKGIEEIKAKIDDLQQEWA